VAVIFAIRAGLRDARAGGPAYFWAVLMDLDHRKDLLREGWKDVCKIFVVAMVLDVICQLIVFRWPYPGEAPLVATIPSKRRLAMRRDVLWGFNCVFVRVIDMAVAL
jgi:hypothetical protein